MNEIRRCTIDEMTLRILRTNPTALNLYVDKFGFAQVDKLLDALISCYDNSVTYEQLIDLLSTQLAGDVELTADRKFVRALAHHERHMEVGITKGVPTSELLYCVINKNNAEHVASIGLVPSKNFNRVFVDISGAINQHKKSMEPPAICIMNKNELLQAGFEFYFIDGYEWFIEQVPPQYLTIAIPESGKDIADLTKQCSAVSHYLKEN